MTDDRTAEQKAAAENLLDAIQQVQRLRDRDDDDMADPTQTVVTDFVVIAACNSIELMERNSTQYAYFTKNDGYGHDSTPAHGVLGLLYMGLDWFQG
jgi:hypothetical protein